MPPNNTFSFNQGVRPNEPRPESRPDGTSPRMYRGKPVKEAASEKLAKWPPDAPTGVADETLLMWLTEATIIRLLTSDLDAKTMCGVVANSVRLLQVKEKMKVDDDDEVTFADLKMD